MAVSRVGRLETNLSPRLIEIDRFGIEGLSVVDLIAGRHRTEMASELHRRSAAPLGWVALILLGLPLMMRCGDASPLMGFALSLLMTGVYAAAVSIGWSLALSGQVPAAAGAWVPQAAALSAGIAAYWRMRT